MPTIICPICGNGKEVSPSAFNRAKKHCKKLYCGKRCAGIARRSNKTKDQKVKEKQLYDKLYRMRNKELLKAKKAEYFKKNYDPEKARIKRKKNMRLHVQYCRSPKYKRYKKAYDKKYRAKTQYGDFWESYLLVLKVDEILKTTTDRYEIRKQNGILNKTQERRRNYERLNCNKS
jgi:hypothetical protein